MFKKQFAVPFCKVVQLTFFSLSTNPFEKLSLTYIFFLYGWYSIDLFNLLVHIAVYE